MMDASQSGKRDHVRINFPDGRFQIRGVGDEQNVCLMPVRFEHAGNIGDANRHLQPIILDE